MYIRIYVNIIKFIKYKLFKANINLYIYGLVFIMYLL